MIIGKDKEDLPEEFLEVAELADKILTVCADYETAITIRSISSTLSMVVVNTAPSRDAAEGLIESLANTIMEIIEMMDEGGMAGWSESDKRTLQ